ncbi:MAG: 3',5'-cyclic-AMP phosphodiesterase [Lonepinella koalarum]|nr:3',5'-cyclic-AMP phosphodiesterase [Lonepinella koalarum]
MSGSYVYESEKNVVRLLQVTDPHLFADEAGELLGINTLASFEQVLKEVRQQSFAYDLVLATGDLVQDSSDEGYLRFCQRINQLEKEIFWIPGNHDYLPKMIKWLNSSQGNLHAQKHILAGKYWQILLLDSQVFGVPHGYLAEYQLEWLQEKLQTYPEHYSLIVLHHHILPTNSAWLDQHNLRNTHELSAILTRFPKVKGILYGHIHQQVDAQWNGLALMATPSTCIQFKPDCAKFTLDNLQPGWREITLNKNGTIDTQVHRIKQATFLPNFREEGY